MFPRKNTLAFIYLQLLKIQNYLIKEGSLTHQALFERLYPEVAQYYRKVAIANQEKPDFILESISDIYAASAPTLEEEKIILEKKDRNLMSRLALETMSREVYSGTTYSLSEAIEEFIKAIDFANMALETQHLILRGLKEINCGTELTIRNCKALKDELLIALVKDLPQLNRIHLIGCSNVSLSGILTACKVATERKLTIGLLACQKIGPKEYTELVNEGVDLELLALDQQGNCQAFLWKTGNANMILHQMLINNVTLSFQKPNF